MLLHNPVLTTAISIPGSRMFLGQFVGFLISLDRLQLYAYHKRNYSYNYQNLIDGAFKLLDMKGLISEQFV